MIRRYRAVVEYDGTNYFGFQRQRKSHPSVQSVLEEALSRIFQQSATIIAAGRTDRGVHATGQVVSFNSNWRHGKEKLLRAVNANLPSDVTVRSLEEAALTFHPRFDAQRRAYHYYIYNSDTRSSTKRLYSWHVRHTLDMSKMQEAANFLIGKHDFATFGHPPQGNNSVRTIFAAQWVKKDENLIFFIQANAFLYRMVRSIVGSLKAVGSGEWDVGEFERAFFAKERGRAFKTAPPNGLFLTSVEY